MNDGETRIIQLCEIYEEMDEDGKERMVREVEDYLQKQNSSIDEMKTTKINFKE